jgi:hypothetical protein
MRRSTILALWLGLIAVPSTAFGRPDNVVLREVVVTYQDSQ